MDSKLVGSAKEEKCLEELKEIVKKNSEEFENFEWLLDDKFLLHFVRGKKYKIAKASIALKNYIRIRKHQYKPLFLQLDNFEESTIGIRNGAVSVLRHRDAFERTIVVINFTFWPDDMTVDQFTQALVLVTEECWNCQKVETQGVQLIVDLCSFGWNHLKMFTPSVVYKCVNIFWNNMPIRYKNIHLLNPGSIFEILLKGIKPFLPSTLRERLLPHSTDCSELYKVIPQENLPISLGGDLDDEDAYDTELVKRIYAKTEYYQRFVQSL